MRPPRVAFRQYENEEARGALLEAGTALHGTVGNTPEPKTEIQDLLGPSCVLCSVQYCNEPTAKLDHPLVLPNTLSSQAKCSGRSAIPDSLSAYCWHLSVAPKVYG
jgi:hypothetical protein